jgi:hypothetical protein
MHADAKPRSIMNNLGGNILSTRNNPQCIAIDLICPTDLTHDLLRLRVQQLIALYKNKEKHLIQAWYMYTRRLQCKASVVVQIIN